MGHHLQTHRRFVSRWNTTSELLFSSLHILQILTHLPIAIICFFNGIYYFVMSSIDRLVFFKLYIHFPLFHLFIPPPQKNYAWSNRRSLLHSNRNDIFRGLGLSITAANCVTFHSTLEPLVFNYLSIYIWFISHFACWKMQTILYLSDHSIFFLNHFEHVALGIICTASGLLHLLTYVLRTNCAK